MSQNKQSDRLRQALYSVLEQHLAQTDTGHGLPLGFEWVDDAVARDENGDHWRVELSVSVQRAWADDEAWL